MRVVFVYQFARNSSGAYMRRVRQLRKGLEEAGVETTEFFFGETGIRGPTPFYTLSGGQLLRALKDADAIHAGSIGPAGICSLYKLVGRIGAKLIYDVHGDVIAEAASMGSLENPLSRYLRLAEVASLEFLSLRCCDAAVTCSKPLNEILVKRGFRDKPIEILRNGIDVNDSWTPPASSPSPFVLSLVSGRAPWQDFDMLMDAVSMLESEDNLRIRIIGPTSRDVFGADCRKESRIVEVIPYVTSQTELLDMMKKSDAFLLPRKRTAVSEAGFPMKYSEYCLVGRPVITTSVGEVATITRREDCGIVCEPNPASLAGAIQQLMHMDSEKRDMMAANARNVAMKYFDNRKIAKRYCAFLESILSS